jgi:hypothetical protein
MTEKFKMAPSTTVLYFVISEKCLFYFIYLFIINRVKLQLIIFLKTNFLQKIYKKQKRHR